MIISLVICFSGKRSKRFVIDLVLCAISHVIYEGNVSDHEEALRDECRHSWRKNNKQIWEMRERYMYIDFCSLGFYDARKHNEKWRVDIFLPVIPRVSCTADWSPNSVERLNSILLVLAWIVSACQALRRFLWEPFSG